MAPRISVITAVFNNRAGISEAIDSVLGQTYSGIEPVVIDGGSTDGTLEVLERCRERLGVLVSEPDRGIYDALNKGIRRSSGEVVGFLHSDDLFFDRESVSRIAAAFSDPAVAAVYGDLLYVKKDDTAGIVRHWVAGPYSPERLRRGWMPPHPTLYVRRAVYERIGLFDTRYRIAADYDWMLRFFTRENPKCVYIPEPLVRMRMGGASNRSLSQIARKSWEDYSALRRNRVGGAGTLLMKNLRKLPQFFGRPKTA